MQSNETDEMFTLGQAVFLEGLEKLEECKERDRTFTQHRDELIIKKRLAVVEFVHGLELILKAVLIRNDYCINTIRRGIYKNNALVKDSIIEDRTVDLDDVIKFFKHQYPGMPWQSVDKLKLLRNQIIHRGTQIDKKKREYFEGAIDCLVDLYDKEKINHNKFLNLIQEAKLLI
jgi:hypothetical protein